MLLRKIKSAKEIAECVAMYNNHNDQSFMQSDFEVSVRNLKLVWQVGAFLRVVEQDGEIVAWILGMKNNMGFSIHDIMQQMFYYSNLRGFAAARAVRLCHAGMVDYAEERRIRTVVSTCSFADERNVMARILEKDGWRRRGHTAVYHTKHHRV